MIFRKKQREARIMTVKTKATYPLTWVDGTGVFHEQYPSREAREHAALLALLEQHAIVVVMLAPEENHGPEQAG
jgi:hypothetical protein